MDCPNPEPEVYSAEGQLQELLGDLLHLNSHQRSEIDQHDTQLYDRQIQSLTEFMLNPHGEQRLTSSVLGELVMLLQRRLQLETEKAAQLEAELNSAKAELSEVQAATDQQSDETAGTVFRA